MDHKLNIFQAITQRMDWLSRRQKVLAQNIANADSPDYVPMDMKSGIFKRILARAADPVGLEATHSKHFGFRGRSPRDMEPEEQRDYYESSPAGNAVVLEEQLVKVAETQMDYQIMTNLYQKHLQMLRAAIGRSG